MPAKDEQETVAAVILDFLLQGAGMGRDLSVLVIDDNSRDRTAEQALAAGARVVRNKGSGLASAFRTGVQEALGLGAEIIVQVDADGQYRAADLGTLVTSCETGADLAIGDRTWRRPQGMSAQRYALNRIASLALSLALRTNLADTQSGFRAFTVEVAAHCRITGNYTYTHEQVIRAVRQGFTISFVPVGFRARSAGRSRLMTSAWNYIACTVPDICRVLLRSGDL
ncbi:glycosyltransferase family 2 protein [Streptomyces sp. NPDC047022]|uniref:glycosyltransferase family 2 protein n=1 Tax=Streptomyces sp. NPDC047022 TaxID=3155737 RepID=UPI0033C06075